MAYYTIRNPKRPGFIDRILSFSATTWLIIITSIFSIIGFILWGYSWSPLPNSISYFALQPSSILQGKYLWTLLANVFTHVGFLHLFVNMIALFSLGGLCEKIIGRKRFVWFYLIAGIFASIFSVLLIGFFGFGFWAKILGTPEVYMVGASGAIFGVAGLLMALLPKLKFYIIFLPFFSLPAYVMVPLVLFGTWAVSLAFGLAIGNVAHLGGFLAGIIYGYYLKDKYRTKLSIIQRQFR